MDENGGLGDGRITTFGRIIEAHAFLTHLLGREMEDGVGLPLLWYGVLLHVGRSPGGVRAMSELVDATAFTSGGITRLVDRIEQAGYVERRPCPTDRRVHFVGLTEKGREILERATTVHVDGIQRHLIDRLDPHDVVSMERILALLVGGDVRDRRDDLGRDAET